MIAKNAKCCVLLIFGILFLINPVSAAINTISPGDTVFIGEQGLDISAAMAGDTQLGWWASAAVIATTSPDRTVPVSNSASFSISQSTFGGYTGAWYHLNALGQANGLAFNVQDPQLSIRVEDTTVDVDVTDKWVPSGDALRFRIDTNLYPIAGRSGGAPTPITIKVQSPDGAIFTSLISNNGVTTPIVDYSVTTSPQYTGSIWGTDNRDAYPPGTYTVWAECNANGMKDNYEVAGKTVSRKVTVLNQDQNPLIRQNVPSASPTPPTSPPTMIVTTISTPKPTTALITPTPALTQAPVSSATTVEPTVTLQPTLAPTKTKAAGFAPVLAGFALIVVLAFCAKKE